MVASVDIVNLKLNKTIWQTGYSWLREGWQMTSKRQRQGHQDHHRDHQQVRWWHQGGQGGQGGQGHGAVTAGAWQAHGLVTWVANAVQCQQMQGDPLW